MKCLLVGEYFSENLGDGVLCKSTEILLQTEFPNIEIDVWDLSGRSSFNKNAKPDKTWILKWKLIQYKILGLLGLMKLYLSYREKRKLNKNKAKQLDYDFIIFAGGQVAVPGFEKNAMNVLRKFKCIPKVINAIGNNSNNETWINDTLCKDYNIKGVTFRDGHLFLENIMCKNTFDTAILSNLLIEKLNDDFTIERNIGIGIMYLSNVNEKIQNSFWDNVFRALHSFGIKYKIFVNGDPNDYDYAVKLCQKHGIDKAILCKRPEKPEELVTLISSFKSIFSMRLHSHIIAYSLCIPSIGVVWDSKVKQFFEKINFSERVLMLDADYNSIENKIGLLSNLEYDVGAVNKNKDIVKERFHELIETLNL